MRTSYLSNILYHTDASFYMVKVRKKECKTESKKGNLGMKESVLVMITTMLEEFAPIICLVFHLSADITPSASEKDPFKSVPDIPEIPRVGSSCPPGTANAR